MRKAWVFRSICVGALLCALNAKASDAFRLVADLSQSPGADAASVSRFLDDAESRLPNKLKETIGKSISVRFLPLEVHGNPEDVCTDSNARFVAGDVQGLHPSSLEINSALLPYISSGPGKHPLACKHQDLYTQALGTVLHELAHVYDSSLNLSIAEKAELTYCEVTDQSTQDDRCLYLKNLTRGVSDRRQFQALGGWNRGEMKNNLDRRFPESYERTHPAEYFAVNFEYFLLDPEYACRRPAHYQYFSHEFGTRPFDGGNCQHEFKAPEIKPTGGIANLDPDRVYQIHYFIAGPGDDVASRWGHAMLRIVVCNPKRETVSSECLNDIDDQVIVSYRANETDLITSHWKGLTGQYASQLYLVGLGPVMHEYNRIEFRSLYSIPLKLDRDQIRTLVGKVTENAWSYRSRYYFTNNNCASETRDLLAPVIDDSSSFHYGPQPNTPAQLRKALLRAGLIDASGQDMIVYGPTNKAKFEEAYQTLKKSAHLPYASSEEYFSKSRAAERKVWIHASASDQELAGFFLLENQIRELMVKNIKKSYSALLQDPKNAKPEWKQTLTHLNSLYDKLDNWNLLQDRRYGVPLSEDWNARRLHALNEVDTVEQGLDRLTTDEFPELTRESLSIDDNVAFILKKVIFNRR